MNEDEIHSIMDRGYEIADMINAFIDKWHDIIVRDRQDEVELYSDAIRKESKALGVMIYEYSGIDGMIYAHHLLPDIMKRLVEIHWGHIGEWRG